jgi:hypothetical protein
MGAIFESILQVFAGLGLAFVSDKFLPAPTGTTTDYRTGFSSWGPVKIAVFAVILVVGSFLAIFVGKKLKIFKRK